MLAKIDFLGDGKTSIFQIPFNYDNKEQIKVYVNEIETSFEFLNKNLIKIDIIPDSNKIITIMRFQELDDIELFSNGEMFEEKKTNKIKNKILNFLQQVNEIEITSLEKSENGVFFRDLDMNFNKVKNIGDAINEKDIVNLKKLNEFLPFEKQQGFKIGDNFLSARSDQLVEKKDGIDVYIDRSFDQKLLKSEYPELAQIYPESAGGISNLYDYGTKIMPNDIKDYTNLFYDKNLNDGSFYYRTDNDYFAKFNSNNTSTLISQIPKTGSNGYEGITSNNDHSIIIANSINSVSYSLDGGYNFNFSNINSVNGITNIYFINCVFIKGVFLIHGRGTLNGSTENFLMSSFNGIDFNMILINDLFSDAVNFNHFNFSLNKRIPNFFVKNDKLYYYPNSTSNGYNFAMLEINNNITSATVIYEGPKQTRSFNYFDTSGKGIKLEVVGSYLSIYITKDFGITETILQSFSEPDGYSEGFYSPEDNYFYYFVNKSFNGYFFHMYRINLDTINEISNGQIEIFYEGGDRFDDINKLHYCIYPSYLDNYKNIIYYTYSSGIFFWNFLEFEIGSNITFDIPKILNNTNDNKLKYYTKGK